jgi:polyhydroxyalkanoate synthesis regulator phasin
MSEALDVGQWARNWEAMARQAQTAMAGGEAKAWNPAAGSNAWVEAMGKLNPLSGSSAQSEAMERLMSGAQGYLGMLQSLAAAVGGKPGAGTEDAAPAFANGFFSGALPGVASGNPIGDALRGFAGPGARRFDQMMERFAAATAPLYDRSRAALNMPAFGHLREKQENLQEIARVFIDYQEQSARYDRLMLKVGEQSFARFQLKLAEREEPGRQIESVRALYDLWIDAAEEAYAEIALTGEFREVYAAVVDAQMRVRRKVQGEIEKFCNELGMPTRSEVDSIGERLQALRREFRRRDEDTGVEALKAEVDALRRELKALQTVPAKKPRRAAPRRPAVSRTRPAAEPAKVDKESKTEPVAKPKPRRAPAKVAGKTPVKRRVKHARPAAVTTRRADAGKSPPKPSTPAVARKSFAASIARFARKSKSSAGGRGKGSAKAASRSQGGSR